MEKRIVVKVMKSSPRGVLTARIWRITKGVTKAETGKMRVHLYHRGILRHHSMTLCRDMPEAERVARFWVRDNSYYVGTDLVMMGSEAAHSCAYKEKQLVFNGSTWI